MSLNVQREALIAAADALTTAIQQKVIDLDERVVVERRAVETTYGSMLNKNLFVDAVLGLDTNEGGRGSPVKTIAEAVNRVLVGGSATIHLMGGQTFEVGAGTPQGTIDVNHKSITFTKVGVGDNPVILGIGAPYPPSHHYVCNAFTAPDHMNLKFSQIVIDTGTIPTKGTLYTTNDWGGFFCRSNDYGASAKYELKFWSSKLIVRDYPTMTTLYGYLDFAMATTTVERAGPHQKVLGVAIPKVLDFHNVTIRNYAQGVSVEDLFSMTPNAYIARKSAINFAV